MGASGSGQLHIPLVESLFRGSTFNIRPFLRYLINKALQLHDMKRLLSDMPALFPILF